MRTVGTRRGNTDIGPGAASSRLAWVDAGRGLAILLVALFHSASWLVAAGASVSGWVEFNLIVSSLRMPLFFVLSGLFAAKWLVVGWGELWRGKVRMFAWVFLLWSFIGSCAFTIGVRLMKGEGSLGGTLIPFAISPVVPRLELWFIWALALFFCLAKLTARVDPRLQLAVAGVASMVALSGWVTTSPGWNGAVKYYAFFLAGLYGRAVIIRFGQTRNVGLLAAAFAAWLVCTLVLWQLDLREVPGLYFLNCVLGVVAGIALSRLLSLAFLRRIGSQTLPIYLAHTPLVIAVCVLLDATGATSVDGLAFVLPPLVMAVSVWGALRVHSLAPRLRLEHLYAAPRWFPGAVPAGATTEPMAEIETR